MKYKFSKTVTNWFFFLVLILNISSTAYCQVEIGYQGKSSIECQVIAGYPHEYNGDVMGAPIPSYRGKYYIPPSINKIRYGGTGGEFIGTKSEVCQNWPRMVLAEPWMGTINMYKFYNAFSTFNQCGDLDMECHMTMNNGVYGNFTLVTKYLERVNAVSGGCKAVKNNEGYEDWRILTVNNFCKLRPAGQFGNGIVTNSINVEQLPSKQKVYTIKANNGGAAATIDFAWSGAGTGYCTEVFQGGQINVELLSKDGVLSYEQYTWTGTVDKGNYAYGGFSKTITSAGLYEYKVLIKDRYNNEYYTQTFFVRLVPDCYNDPLPNFSLTPGTTNPGTIEVVEGGYNGGPRGGYKLEQGKEYLIDFGANVTNFCVNYTVLMDDGSVAVDNLPIPSGTTCDFTPNNSMGSSHMQLSYTGTPNTYMLKILDPIGSFRVYASKRDGLGTYCRRYEPVNIFVGGQNYTAPLSKCLIYIPRDLKTIFPSLEPVVSSFGIQYVLAHFSHDISSSQGIIFSLPTDPLIDEIVLTEGAFVHLNTKYEQPLEELVDNNRNWQQKWLYDEEGNVISESKEFFDFRGRITQVQKKNLTEHVVLATENFYDKYGRLAISTLPAPVSGSNITQATLDCGDNIRAGSDMFFIYKDDFATVNNQKLSYENFDEYLGNNKINAPDPLDNSVPGSLGWYYSVNNDLGAAVLETQKNFIEPNVASSHYPYSRKLYMTDGSGLNMGVTLPGDYHHSGTSKFPQLIEIKSASNLTDYPTLINYLSIRNTYLFPGVSTNPTDVTGMGQYYRAKAKEEESYKEFISYYDKAGHEVIKKNILTGDEEYKYYDAAGRLICIISPKGVSQIAGTNNFALVDKIIYKYNHRGSLLEKSETDNGVTRYIYQNDGLLRFIQKAKQVSTGRFNYIVYDAMGRPIESGEFTPSGGLSFGSQAMKDLLNFGSVNYDLHTGGLKSEVSYIVYDVADENAISSLKIDNQNNIIGKVSYHYKMEGNNRLSTWFSYDEQGRVEWMSQELPGLGVKKIEYRYDPKGGIKEVAYQRGNQDQFYHIYTYDADARLDKVYTTTFEPMYSGNSVISEVDLHDQYEYYLHGTVKRRELGEATQGIDYTYTIQGWLKAINNPDNSKDPGKDGQAGNGFATDVFSMQLDYFHGDYSKTGSTTSNFVTYNDNLHGTYQDRFDGLIIHNTWYTKKNSGQDNKQGYAYIYNDRGYLNNAVFGYKASGSEDINITSDQYSETLSSYDRNGNILSLTRKNETGGSLNNLIYQYDSYTNRLLNTSGYSSYTYNASGEITSVTKNGSTKYVKTNSGGLVEGVFYDANLTIPLVKMYYDNFNVRYKKETYTSSGQLSYTTYYSCDLKGNPLAIYDDNNVGKQLTLQEFYIYGKDKIGSIQDVSNSSTIVYELKDHVGSIRATVSPVKSTPSATITSNLGFEGGDYDKFFSGDYSSYQSTLYKRTGSKSIALAKNNNIPGKGPLIRQRVRYGDAISASIYSFSSQNVGGSLIVKFVNSEGNTLYTQIGDEYQAIWRVDRNGAGWYQHATLFSVPSILYYNDGHAVNKTDVYVEIFPYVDDTYSTVYFDDMMVLIGYNEVRNISQNIINSWMDYYPFGMEMPNKNYHGSWASRNQYQGEYAEKDSETDWHAFDLRMYDAAIGRWLGPDPYRQFYSSYLAMGNNPVNFIDRDGGWSTFDGPGDDNKVYESNKIRKEVICRASKEQMDDFWSMGTLYSFLGEIDQYREDFAKAHSDGIWMARGLVNTMTDFSQAASYSGAGLVVYGVLDMDPVAVATGATTIAAAAVIDTGAEVAEISLDALEGKYRKALVKTATYVLIETSTATLAPKGAIDDAMETFDEFLFGESADPIKDEINKD